MTEPQPPLGGIRVLDVATLFAGPLIATFLGDFGADVVKVEHPRGDPVRVHGPARDGVPLWWKAISTSTQSVAERVMRLVGRPEVIAEPWFAGGAERARHAEELDAAVGGWIGRHDLAEVLAAFEEAEAAVAPIYDVADVMADPQYQALGSIVGVPDEELGTVKMQNVLFRMLGTPGRIRWAGRRLGQDNEAVYGELGISPGRLRELRARGVV